MPDKEVGFRFDERGRTHVARCVIVL